jgi:hypothetical protein
MVYPQSTSTIDALIFLKYYNGNNFTPQPSIVTSVDFGRRQEKLSQRS